MGLDMYLKKHTYVQQWDHIPPEKRYHVSVQRGGENVSSINPERISSVIEGVAYWRKANAIHNWFVEHLADGTDDCRDIDVSREDLQKLLDVVATVLASCKVVKGKIQNGSRTTSDGKEEPIMEDGEYIEDPSVAEALLPTQSGFFFGSTDYDQHYIEDLQYTQKAPTEILSKGRIRTVVRVPRELVTRRSDAIRTSAIRTPGEDRQLPSLFLIPPPCAA